MTKKKIMIIDDEIDFLRVVKLNLEKTGKYEVATESKGLNALASIRAFKPGLVLLDIMMPDVDGGEVARQIEADEELKDIPVVFLTAAVSETEIKSKGSIIGKRLFIAKPVSLEKLIGYIEKNIGK